MLSEFKFKQRLIKSNAPYCSIFRAHHSPEFYGKLFQKLELDEQAVVLCSGCSAGAAALDIAPFVKKVYIQNLRADCKSKVEALAEQKGLINIEWIDAPWENINKLGLKVDLTILDSFFHNREREQLISDLFDITKANGAVALIGNFVDVSWFSEIVALADKYMDANTDSHAVYHCIDGTDFKILKASKFSYYSLFNLKYNHCGSLEEMVDNCLLYLPWTPDLLNDAQESFKQELVSLLQNKSADDFKFEAVEFCAMVQKKRFHLFGNFKKWKNDSQNFPGKNIKVDSSL